MRDEKGRFLPGNPGGALKQPKEDKIEVLDDIGELRRSGYHRILKKFKNMSQMTLREFQERSKNETSINIEDAAFMSFFKNLIKQGDVHRMRFYFATYGIPTELKAIAVQDIDQVLGKKEETSEFDIEMSDEETLLMLDKMKEIVEKKKENK